MDYPTPPFYYVTKKVIENEVIYNQGLKKEDLTDNYERKVTLELVSHNKTTKSGTDGQEKCYSFALVMPEGMVKDIMPNDKIELKIEKIGTLTD